MDFDDLSAIEKHEHLVMSIQNELDALQISAVGLEKIIDEWKKEYMINSKQIEKLKDKIFSKEV